MDLQLLVLSFLQLLSNILKIILTSIPIILGKTKISEKMIAASISNCFVGYKVISAAINGFWQVAKKSISALISLYSGKYLPAYLLFIYNYIPHHPDGCSIKRSKRLESINYSIIYLFWEFFERFSFFS